ALLDNVVNTEQVVIDDSLDDVEDSPAENQRAEQHPARPGTTPFGSRPEQQDHAGDCEPEAYRMEESVPEHVDLRIHERVFRADSRQHVVNLKKLMQEDAVDESAQPDTEHRSRRYERTCVHVRNRFGAPC